MTCQFSVRNNSLKDQNFLPGPSWTNWFPGPRCKLKWVKLTLLGPGRGGTLCPPVTYLYIRIYVYNRANTRTSLLKKLDFSQLWVWKRAVCDQQKNSKLMIFFLEFSRHQKFMNPFEYGESFVSKSFPKGFGTLTPPNPKIFRGL